MPSNERVKRTLPSAVLVLVIVAAAAPHGVAAAECKIQDTGITLSPGFCATVFADNLGHVRHLAVSSDNVVYANTWSGRYYHNATPPPSGFLLAQKDTTGSAKANVIQRFGPDKSAGAGGGTGIALYNGALYAELNDKIVRYARTPGEIAPASKAETVLSGMPLTGEHTMHPFIVDVRGSLFVDLGSATNACQSENRFPLSPGLNPYTELETRAGIWRYDANKTDQTFSTAARYASGIRVGVRADQLLRRRRRTEAKIVDWERRRMQISTTMQWKAIFRSAGIKNPTPRIQTLDGFNEGWISFSGAAEKRRVTLGLEQALSGLVKQATSN